MGRFIAIAMFWNVLQGVSEREATRGRELQGSKSHEVGSFGSKALLGITSAIGLAGDASGWMSTGSSVFRAVERKPGRSRALD
jgi:hypothetical protein